MSVACHQWIISGTVDRAVRLCVFLNINRVDVNGITINVHAIPTSTRALCQRVYTVISPIVRGAYS